MGFLFWLLSHLSPHRRRTKECHRVGPGEFLAVLKKKRPGKLTIDRVTGDGEAVQWRISFAVTGIEDDALRTDTYVIFFSEQFVPAPFRAFIDGAVWKNAPDSEFADRIGTVKNPLAKIGGG